MDRILAQTLYLFAPLLFSAVLSGVVIRFDWLRSLRKPIDAGILWRGRRLLGDGKTWRGVAVAIVGSVFFVGVQRTVTTVVPPWLALLDYSPARVLLFGVAMGCGAMIGELPNSFIKRRLGIDAGETSKGARAVLFYVYDQVDLVFGSWVLIWPWVAPRTALVVASFALALVLHPLVALIGYLVGARRSAR